MRLRVSRAACLAAWLCVDAAHAAPAPGDDPFTLVHEEQTATGALKRPQPLSETPSSVTVITASEMRAAGYHTVGEALRWVRGLFVTYDRNYWYVGVRGLQRPGDYNNKVLLALDGHTLNGNVYGDALFGPDLGIDLEDVERIEVVRGPGSALYGSYAALAVVNVVTRQPRGAAGWTIAGRAGSFGERRMRASTASAVPGGPEWSASLSWLDAQGGDLYFPEYDGAGGNGRAESLDGERALSFYGGARWGEWRLAVKANHRDKDVPTGSFGVTFGDPDNRTVDARDFVELSRSARPSSDLELHARAWWDGARYRGTYVYGEDSSRVLNQDLGDGDVVGTEWRTNWSAGERNAVTAGLEGQLHVRARLANWDESPPLLAYDHDERSRLVGLYFQDELRFGSSVRLTAGARVDGQTGHSPVLSPRLDLVWHSDAATTWRLLAGSAFRAPSPWENAELGGVVRQRLDPERVFTVEGGLNRRFGTLTAGLAAYHSEVKDLIDQVEVDAVTSYFRNRDAVDADGIEGELELLGAGRRVRLAGAWQRCHDEGDGSDLSNSPRWNAHLVAIQAPPGADLTFGGGVRYLSPRRTLAGAWTAAAFITDLRLAHRVARTGWLGLEAKNLFDARYGDPGSSEHVQDQIEQDGRTVYLTLSIGDREP